MEKCNLSINQIWNFNSTSVFYSNSFLPAVFVGEFLSVFKLLLLPAIIMHIAGVCIFAARTIIFFFTQRFFLHWKVCWNFFSSFFYNQLLRSRWKHSSNPMRPSKLQKKLAFKTFACLVLYTNKSKSGFFCIWKTTDLCLESLLKFNTHSE